MDEQVKKEKEFSRLVIYCTSSGTFRKKKETEDFFFSLQGYIDQRKLLVCNAILWHGHKAWKNYRGAPKPGES
jgi:hypothetical protein